MNEQARDSLVSVVKKHGTEQDSEFLNIILILARAKEFLITMETNRLKNLLRQLFYYRLPLGEKVEERIAEENNDLWKEIYGTLEVE